MRFRLLLTAVLISLVSVVPTWVSLQPLMSRTLGAGRWQGVSAVILALDLVLATVVTYLVLRFARPASRAPGRHRASARQRRR